MRHSLSLTLAALLLLVPAVDAREFQDISGNYGVVVDSANTTFEQISENMCIWDTAYTLELTGDLTASVYVVAKMKLKGDCFDWAAAANVHGQGSCQGATLDGQSGAFDVNAVFQHGNYMAWGQMTIQHATGELAGLHGHIDIQGVAGVGGTYTGKVHFAP